MRLHGDPGQQPAHHRQAAFPHRPHGEGARVGGEQRAFLVLPGEKVLRPGPARRAHRRAPLAGRRGARRSIARNRSGPRRRRIRLPRRRRPATPRGHRRRSDATSPCTRRSSPSKRGRSRGFFGSGARQTSEVESTRQIVSCSTQPVNSTLVVEAELQRQGAHLIDHVSVAHEHRVPVVSRIVFSAASARSALIDPVLRTHHAHVAEQESLAPSAATGPVPPAQVELRSGPVRTTATSSGSRCPRSIATRR